jgi:3-phenylpropionate/trans-cinnamate dioxygenase ferredoxin subunit
MTNSNINDNTDSLAVWVRLCTLSKIPANKAIGFTVNGQRMIVVRCGEQAQVMQGYCSHMLYPLADSKIDGCVLTCALHRSKFDARDGAVVEWGAFPPVTGTALDAIRAERALRTYETRIDGDDVFLQWPAARPEDVRISIRL